MVEAKKGVALVTGGADRIGAFLARRLAVEGYAVVIHCRSSVENAEALVAAIRKAGGQAAFVVADLLSRTERSKVIANAAAPFGPINVLVNNASLFEPDAVADLGAESWDRHFGVHMEAPVFLARDFAAQLPDEMTGNIINIVDARVLNPTPAYFSYGLSKLGMWNATITLAQSLAPRIRVNALAPGATLPERGVSDSEFAKWAERLPLGRTANPGDLADAMIYVLGAKSMTGQMLALDGGEHVSFPKRRGPTPANQ